MAMARFAFMCAVVLAASICVTSAQQWSDGITFGFNETGLVRKFDAEEEMHLVSEVNRLTSAWKAAPSHGQTFHKLRRGDAMMPMPALPSDYNTFRDSSLPSELDLRKKFPACTGPVLDQGSCGSCWAFAATEVLSNRFCIASNGTETPTLSPEDLLACEHLNLHCTCGSMPSWAWSFLVKTGVTSLDCVPYTSGEGETPRCPKQCTNDDGASTRHDPSFTHYKAKSYFHAGDLVAPAKHVTSIMQALQDGPLDATFNVFADFMSYDGGVYHHTTGGYEGLHSVKIMGYGDDATGGPYWLVQNSWGSDWGIEGGFFKIKRGSNDCGFERLVYGGTPDLSTISPITTKVVQ